MDSLATFFQIPAAYFCEKLPRSSAAAPVVGASILQAALGTAMIRFVVP